MQAGHSPETAHSIYAIDISKVFARQQNLASTHYKISCQWHEALQFDILNKSQTDKTDTAQFRVSNRELEERIGMDYLLLLRENFRSHAWFRG